VSPRGPTSPSPISSAAPAVRRSAQFEQGLRIRMAMNHWKLAVETHNTNFPDTDHDTCDISAADPTVSAHRHSDHEP
jgi:site-specific DNA-cytosine methylase